MSDQTTSDDGSVPASQGDGGRLGPALLKALDPVFEGQPLFVSDSREIVAWLLEEGCSATEFSDVDDIPAEELARVAILPTDSSRLPQYERWHELFGESRLLFVPVGSFDPSLSATKYTLQMLATTSVTSAVDRNVSTLNELMEVDAPMVVRGDGTDLRIELEDDVTVLRPKVEYELAPGEWESVGSYFEVGLVPTPEDFKTGMRPGYIVDGEVEVPGIAVACQWHAGDEIRVMQRQAWALLDRVRQDGGFPLRLTIENSRVVSVLAGGKDIKSELAPLTNPSLGSVLTEMAFSTNAALDPDVIDWSHNSQMNEGALGIHVALGDGVTGAHIDFMCPGAVRVADPK